MAIGRRELNLELPADPRAVGEARDTVKGSLARARPEVCEDVRLLVSELVTNSLRHGNLRPGDDVRVHVRATPEAVRVEVDDDGGGIDEASLNGPRGDGGYGLYLVRRLADRWGIRTSPGTHVWFEMDRPFREADDESGAA